jgi:hypothetical protein
MVLGIYDFRNPPFTEKHVIEKISPKNIPNSKKAAAVDPKQ